MGVATGEAEEGHMIIVSNTGPLLHLSEAHALHLLRFAGNVLSHFAHELTFYDMRKYF